MWRTSVHIGRVESRCSPRRHSETERTPAIGIFLEGPNRPWGSQSKSRSRTINRRRPNRWRRKLRGRAVPQPTRRSTAAGKRPLRKQRSAANARTQSNVATPAATPLSPSSIDFRILRSAQGSAVKHWPRQETRTLQVAMGVPGGGARPAPQPAIGLAVAPLLSGE